MTSLLQHNPVSKKKTTQKTKQWHLNIDVITMFYVAHKV